MGALDRVFRSRRPSQDRPAAAIVAGLWRNGEQGARYEAGDLATMFQDAAGTLPVYAPGQGQVDPPVGLWLDKRLGLLKGPERLTASWATDAGISYAGSALTFAAAPSSSYATNTGTVAAGKWYEATFTVTGFSGSGGVSWAFNTVSTGNVITANGTYTQLLLAANSGPAAVRARLAATTAVVSNISLKELPGNHAYQTTTTSRPTLSARYNLLTRTEDFSVAAAVWSTGVAGTGSAPVRTAGYATAPDGTLTATRLQLSLNGGAATSDRSGVTQTIAAVTQAASYKGGVWLKATTPADIGKTVLLRHAGGNTYYPCVLTADWKIFGRVEAAATSYAVFELGLRGASGGASDSIDMLVWGADMRAVSDGVGLPEYQRVVDANTYDTAGFPLYLKFDGVDDGLQTASIDFSGSDKVFCAASFRKLSDATTGSLFELSATIASNPGSFYITAPGAVNSGNIKLATKGTTEVNVATTAAGYPSPVSAIASAVMDIAAPISTLRVNGAVAQSSSASLGSGSLGNYPLYIGRRAGSFLPLNGRLYGLLIRAGAINDGQIQKVEKLLNQKAKVF